MRLMLPLLSAVAVAAFIAADRFYGPADMSICSNKFMDRPMCPGKPRRCGGEVDQVFCPGRELSTEEIKQLMSVPVDQRPPWYPGWGVPKY